ncbi:hypothetical protein TR51_27750 [Kitasatospora griseola]|uniref:Ricin B lectin domain-containing protein n=1 Tax=Kitasatospora griseola TaxID=2064 RepID=A0A0D0NUB8_KITGR|nr:hypothetical protein [Kitasatospora griseola]KIQ62746.1 hypothetical protein TR51_27750 [Kitasatospora griseola]
MIRTKTATALGALCLAAAGVSVAATPVSATPAPAGQQSQAGLLGIGTRVTTRVDTPLYFGPGLSTPQIGVAWAGDNVAGICQIYDNNNKRLILAIERPGRNGVQWANTAGYIWDDFIIQYTAGFPLCLSYGPRVTPIRDTTIYSGQGLSTPRVGVAWAGDDVEGICKVNDNNGKRMDLVIERPGRNGVQWANSAGYVWDLDIAENTDALPDCGTV